MRPFRVSVCSCLLAACTTLPPYAVPAPEYPRQGLVAVDIDGTLTPRDSAFLEAREGAAQALATYVRKGYTIVYLSARVPLLQQGVPARVAMEVLGHSQISLTLGTYSHVVPELADEAAERMGSALWG